MIERPKLPIEAFDYHLPDERIAYTPAKDRAESKLLVWDKKIIAESTYAHIADFIPEKSTLLFNNSKVIAARIFFEKNKSTISTTADSKENPIEIFCLEPSAAYSPVALAMQATEKVSWICLVGGAKKWKEGLLEKTFFLHDKTYTVFAQKIEAIDGKFLIEFSWEGAIHFSEIIEQIGNIPLPPYIQRDTTAEDKERYQTTYAKEEGSVAAPTAGLHFNEKIFESLATKKIESAFITLHVGAGTFLPVKTENINDHPMHAEFFEVQKSMIEFLLKKEIEKENLDRNEKALPIISVGTTTLRTIESLYWLGVKIIRLKNTSTLTELLALDLKLLQWDAYEFNSFNISNTAALTALLEWMEMKKTFTLITTTQLMIVPGYTFKICNGLVTNFHQPKSTLLLIIAAITGNNWKTIYQHALHQQYRFLSYGDGSLFWMH
jgi:S-adenosylmethionine:tRNA ribosyltransferase-isomerase